MATDASAAPPLPTTSTETAVAPGVVGAALSAILEPQLSQLESTLSELAQSHALLAEAFKLHQETLVAQTQGPDSVLAEASAVLNRVPEYVIRLHELKGKMAAAEAVVTKAERSSASLRAKVEAKEQERSSRIAKAQSGFSAAKAM